MGDAVGFFGIHINNANEISLDSCYMHNALSQNIDLHNSNNISITNCQVDGESLYLRDNTNLTLIGNTITYFRMRSNATAVAAITSATNTNVHLENNQVDGGVTRAVSISRAGVSFVQLYNNVFKSDERTGVTIQLNESDSIEMLNNTCIGTSGASISGGNITVNLELSEIKGRIQNNLFVGNSGEAMTTGAYFNEGIMDYNGYITDTSLYNIIGLYGFFEQFTYTDMATYQNDFPTMDAHSRLIASKFLTDDKINSATEFHFGRTDVGINEDIEGDPRGLFGGAVDVGADEWSGYVSNISKISGTIFFDENGNGELDNDEYGLANQQVVQLPDNLVTTTNEAGEYYFYKLDNTEYIIVAAGATNFSVNPSEIVVPASSAAVEEVDFAYQASKTVSDFEVALTLGLTRCFRTINGNISYTNQGSIAEAVTLSFTPDETYVLASSNPSWDQEINGTYYWEISEVKALEQGSIQLSITMPGTDEIGEEHTSSVQIENAAGLLDEKDYVYELICSYDPNDKSVAPAGYGEDHLVLNTDSLEYLIRFQNTGNDTAFDIRIVDQLSENLDWNSFELLSSSHEVRPELNQKTGQLIFYYDDIQLVDSVANEPDSHGFVKFRIYPKSDLADSTLLLNTAYIYFDFNPPIVTNTTSSLLVDEIPEEFLPITALEDDAEESIVLYPNPSNGLVQLSLPNANGLVIEVLTLGGRLVHQGHYQQQKASLNLTNLPAGIYIVKIESQNGVASKKLLIR